MSVVILPNYWLIKGRQVGLPELRERNLAEKGYQAFTTSSVIEMKTDVK